MSRLQIIQLPDPYHSARPRHLVCRLHNTEGNLMVLANLATRDAAVDWISGQAEQLRPPMPKFRTRATRQDVNSIDYSNPLSC